MRKVSYKKVGDMLKVNTTLLDLNLPNTFFRPSCIDCLSASLKVNKSLTTLNISHNFFDDEQARTLVNALRV